MARPPFASSADGTWSMPPVGVLRPGVPLRGSIDMEAYLAGVPANTLVKGMFMSGLAAELGPAFAALTPKLLAPPRFGRYLPFSDYPIVDHARLGIEVASRRFPSLDHREAWRRLAREDVLTFLGTMLGRVVASVVDSPQKALLAFPDVFRRVCVGPRYEAEPVGARGVCLRLRGGAAGWEYQVGQLEGAVLHYGGQPEMECSLEPDGAHRFDVRW